MSVSVKSPTWIADFRKKRFFDEEMRVVNKKERFQTLFFLDFITFIYLFDAFFKNSLSFAIGIGFAK